MRKLLWALPVPALLLGVWSFAVAQKWLTLRPGPFEVLLAVFDLTFGSRYDDAYSGTLLTHLFASAGRVVGGFLLAAACAVPLGVLLARYQRLYGRNLPHIVTLTRSPLGSSTFAMSIVKSIALMIPSPNFSWINSLIVVP